MKKYIKSLQHAVQLCTVLLLSLCLLVGCADSSTNGPAVNPSGSESEKENISPEELEPVKEETKVAISDLSKAFSIMKEKASREFYEGYPIDEAFLHWVNNKFGDEAIMDIAYRLYEGYEDTRLWYHTTGNSMHVLWLLYCKEYQFSTYYLENVRFMESKTNTISMDFTGDINFADDWYTMEEAALRPGGVSDCIDVDVVKELQNADISVINNEFVYSNGGSPIPGKEYTFRAKTENVAYLELLGADIANLANNHVFDFGEQGVLDTVATLKNAGISTMGAGANLEEAKAITYVVIGGRKLAFVSATEIERFSNFTKEATETTAGVLKTLAPERYQTVIAEADANSDYVIANVHWGSEGSYRYSQSQKKLAEAFISSGADIVVGGHPHRMHGMEYIGDVPVLYSLGNFWFSTGTLYTMIAQIQIDEHGEIAVRTLPCIQQNLSTRLLTEEETDAFYRFFADISTNVAIDKEGYVYNVANGANPEQINDSNYLSGKNYGSYHGGFDLEGRKIDVVGNLE